MMRFPLRLRGRGLVPVAVGTVLALALAACGSSSPSGGAAAAGGSAECSNIPAGPIKIANIVPLSGPTATAGELLQTESTVMQNYFNAQFRQLTHPHSVADPPARVRDCRRPCCAYRNNINATHHRGPLPRSQRGGVTQSL